MRAHLIHHFEYPIDPLLWRILVIWEFCIVPNHLINGIYNREHLISSDESVLVQIVEFEGPWKNIVYLWEKGFLHCNFSSRLPREVMDKALMNSWNSIAPSWKFILSVKILSSLQPYFRRRLWRQTMRNRSDHPVGRTACRSFGIPRTHLFVPHFPQPLTASVSIPFGQSRTNPLYHCLISFSVTEKAFIVWKRLKEQPTVCPLSETFDLLRLQLAVRFSHSAIEVFSEKREFWRKKRGDKWLH